MIVWLNVPFAQKDAAKRLGARWSAEQKKWYVENVENLAPFLRWIDDRLKQPTKSQPPKHLRLAGRKRRRTAEAGSNRRNGIRPTRTERRLRETERV